MSSKRNFIKDDHGPEMESKRAKIIADIFHEASDTEIAHEILSKVSSDSLVIEQISKNKTLHEVSQSGNVELVKELLSIGVNMDCLNDDGNSPLHIACENKSTEIVEELLKNGANPNMRSTTKNDSALHHVFEKFKFDNEEDNDNKDIIPIIKCLLKHGADINAENDNGKTALFLASFCEDLAAVKLLLNNGAKTNCRKSSPLYEASEYNNIAIVEELLNHGADINPKDGLYIPLYIASKEGHTDLVNKLLERGADVNIHTFFGHTPLHAACEEGDFEIVEILLRNGAKPNLQIREAQEFPIHLATRGGHLEIVIELLKHGADVNVVEEEDVTPLHIAAQSGHITIVKELLNNAANVNASTIEEDQSILHIAIQENFYDHYQESLEIIQLLLKDESIDLNVTNEDGLTPLEKALNLKHMEIARMIAKKMCPLPKITDSIYPLKNFL